MAIRFLSMLINCPLLFRKVKAFPPARDGPSSRHITGHRTLIHGDPGREVTCGFQGRVERSLFRGDLQGCAEALIMKATIYHCRGSRWYGKGLRVGSLPGF